MLKILFTLITIMIIYCKAETYDWLIQTVDQDKKDGVRVTAENNGDFGKKQPDSIKILAKANEKDANALRNKNNRKYFKHDMQNNTNVVAVNKRKLNTQKKIFATSSSLLTAIEDESPQNCSDYLKEKNIRNISKNRCAPNVSDIENFLGTNLFDNVPKKCFTAEDVQLLLIRRDFESLIPKQLPHILLNDQMLNILMDYFENCGQLITTMSTGSLKNLAHKAFYDTIGSYLNFYVVPVAKHSYYAGIATLEAVQKVLQLHQQCRYILNTNGNGWRGPMKDVLNICSMHNIQPLKIAEYKGTLNPCKNLDMMSNHNHLDNDKMIVSLPRLERGDENDYLGNIWLPFRRKRIFDLRSPETSFVIVKFYETLSKCYGFEKVSQIFYNRKLYEWLLENIQNHLSDDIFYPGLGGVLKLQEHLRGFQKSEGQNYLKDNRAYEDDYDNYVKGKKMSRKINDEKSQEFLNVLKNSNRFKVNHQILPNGHYDNGLASFRDNLESNGEEQIKHEKAMANNKNEEMAKETSTIVQETESNFQKPTMVYNNKKEDPHFRITLRHLIIVAISVLLAIVVAIICCLKLKKRKGKKTKESRLREYAGGKKLLNNIADDDEEIELLDSQSKSVLPGNNNSKTLNRYKTYPRHTNNSASIASSSSSSLMCPSPVKCFGKKSTRPAIIDTTLLDSEVEEVKDRKIPQPTKAVKINENPTKMVSLNDRRKNSASANGKTRVSKDIRKK
ncbi:uncharacterized protein LOC106086796 isoform X2 [Stomoxys calcitrans]|uniref:uncharacterized protein LOC106086796 isoform X2 n=1 Tax=Stomoxys calcitrans TaxID=35570 RepID=UPI0027E2C7CD|nr:uncharacterized protein LOC106086796 isoform X2 [Stomoxys calcitrans]